MHKIIFLSMLFALSRAEAFDEMSRRESGASVKGPGVQLISPPPTQDKSEGTFNEEPFSLLKGDFPLMRSKVEEITKMIGVIEEQISTKQGLEETSLLVERLIAVQTKLRLAHTIQEMLTSAALELVSDKQLEKKWDQGQVREALKGVTSVRHLSDFLRREFSPLREAGEKLKELTAYINQTFEREFPHLRSFYGQFFEQKVKENLEMRENFRLLLKRP